MGSRARYAGIFVQCVVVYAALATVSALASYYIYGVPIKTLVGLALSFGLATVLTLAALFAVFSRKLFRPLKIIESGLKIILDANPSHRLEIPPGHLLGDLPESIHTLGDSYSSTRMEISEARSSAEYRMEAKKSYLELVLGAMNDGVIVCDEKGSIIFYNKAIKRIFENNEMLGLGRSIYLLCARAPIENSLRMLREDKHGENKDRNESAPFICSTLHEGKLLSTRVHILPDMEATSWNFMLTCEDVSRQTDTMRRKDNMLRGLIKKLKPPLSNLDASIESLISHPDIQPQKRTSFEKIMEEESKSAIGYFNQLAHEIEDMSSVQHINSDVLSEDLIACAARKLSQLGISLTIVADTLWVNADSNTLLEIIEFLALRIRDYAGVSALEVHTLLHDRHVYFDFYWKGAPVPHSEIAMWQGRKLGGQEFLTLGEALEQHGSDIWSKPHEVSGYAMLRLPIPVSSKQWVSPLSNLPERPVYDDFSIKLCQTPESDILDTPLGDLSYVVFDTETTGLNPYEGDEIVSISGVRIINQGIVVGETFDQLVNPGRRIPESSTRFHGINDSMVAESPDVHRALKSFSRFVGGSILVGHNAAFDMKFIKMKEKTADVAFKQAVLDTLLFSLYLHDHTPDHTLDAIARRLGVEIRDRHTSLGDSMITAEIFLRQIYLLNARGIKTLGQAMEVLKC